MKNNPAPFAVILLTASLNFLPDTMLCEVRAALIDNLNGTVTQIRNDGVELMWIQSADLAGGPTNWWDAMEWAANLDYAGYRDWRLPTTDNAGLGFSMTESEMGYLYYTELGNPPGGPFANAGPFSGLEHLFWSSTEYGEEGAYVFWFSWDNDSGFQNTEYKEPLALSDTIYPWAVRTIPEPATLLLLGCGALTLCKRRQA
jgi:hypothetical protein